MKKVLLGLTVIMAVVVLAGCSKHRSPEALVKNYCKAVKAKNAEKCADCFSYEGTDSEKKSERAENVARHEKGFNLLDEKKGLKDFDIVSTEKKGDDKATVKVKMTYGNGDTDEIEFSVEKIDGKWYM